MLDVMDKLATIATAVVALLAYGQFQWRRFQKRKLLEDYLSKERPGLRSPGDKGRRTVLHLMAALGMTEADILDAGFSSPRIKRSTAQDPESRRAAAIYFEYSN